MVLLELELKNESESLSPVVGATRCDACHLSPTGGGGPVYSILGLYFAYLEYSKFSILHISSCISFACSQRALTNVNLLQYISFIPQDLLNPTEPNICEGEGKVLI